MNIRKIAFLVPLVALLFLFTPGATHATPITQMVTAEITGASMVNPFGVAVGDMFSWSIGYDDSLVPPAGLAWVSALEITAPVNLRTFNKDEDLDRGSGWPCLAFINGNLVGIDFTVSPFTYGTPPTQFGFTTFPDPLSSLYNDFAIFDLTGFDPLNPPQQVSVAVAGNLDLAGVPVPEPASLLLLGSGLIGLAVFRKVRRGTGYVVLCKGKCCVAS